jgi:hypothetical protein
MWVIGIGFIERVVGSFPFWLLVALFVGGVVIRSRRMQPQHRGRRR